MACELWPWACEPSAQAPGPIVRERDRVQPGRLSKTDRSIKDRSSPSKWPPGGTPHRGVPPLMQIQKLDG